MPPTVHNPAAARMPDLMAVDVEMASLLLHSHTNSDCAIQPTPVVISERARGKRRATSDTVRYMRPAITMLTFCVSQDAMVPRGSQAGVLSSLGRPTGRTAPAGGNSGAFVHPPPTIMVGHNVE